MRLVDRLGLFTRRPNSCLHQKTRSLKLAQEQLGHSNLSTTADSYTDVDDEDLVIVADVLGKALGRSCGRAVVENGSESDLIN